jgi:excisionase family DNA binding protein
MESKGDTMSTPVLLTVQDIADRFSLSRSTIQRYIQSGELKSITLGGARRVTEEDLADFLDRMSVVT